jgi:hypothetical protein
VYDIGAVETEDKFKQDDYTTKTIGKEVANLQGVSPDGWFNLLNGAGYDTTLTPPTTKIASPVSAGLCITAQCDCNSFMK